MKTILITVEKTEGDNPTKEEVVIKRTPQRDGTVVFDGRWATPELRADGKYYLKVNLPAPTTLAQKVINRRCTVQLMAMAAMVNYLASEDR